MDKEKALVELCDLLDFFYENRDLPVDSGFDFYSQVKEKCDILEVDYDIVVKAFNLIKSWQKFISIQSKSDR